MTRCRIRLLVVGHGTLPATGSPEPAQAEQGAGSSVEAAFRLGCPLVAWVMVLRGRVLPLARVPAQISRTRGVPRPLLECRPASRGVFTSLRMTCWRRFGSCDRPSVPSRGA